jgi:hypothetical protein
MIGRAITDGYSNDPTNENGGDGKRSEQWSSPPQGGCFEKLLTEKDKRDTGN